MRKEGLVLSNSVRFAVFKVLCEGKDLQTFIKKSRIPLSKALREVDFLEKNGLIKKEGEKYIPTKEGLKVYEIIKQGV